MLFRKKYVFPDNYENLFSDLFYVQDLCHEKIKFTEVCIVNNQQVCIDRIAVMNELYANYRGELFFKGKCKQLKKLRFFELVMLEYNINGKVQLIDKWFMDVTGKSLNNFRQECARKNSTLLWQGVSATTEFKDVYSDVEKGIIQQIVLNRKVQITAIYLDFKNNIYIEHIDPVTNIKGISYPLDLKLRHESKYYTFESWCQKAIGFDLWASITEK
ncbi:hypothetical protein J7384_10885 [Endozoicomonas sp. G2_1]|uniref:hypothetical protein n=1 Tax=Endozoicomonas sp. G2_1 TaxID=2821091 RepID=UPI001ADC55A1|nr:hypothetical protein [Endozoicomonas sp. G2_1]MBO9490862.1 hypothetical protein [Endozoicomonas sp. G2_1]